MTTTTEMKSNWVLEGRPRRESTKSNVGQCACELVDTNENSEWRRMKVEPWYKACRTRACMASVQRYVCIAIVVYWYYH